MADWSDISINLGDTDYPFKLEQLRIRTQALATEIEEARFTKTTLAEGTTSKVQNIPYDIILNIPGALYQNAVLAMALIPRQVIVGDLGEYAYTNTTPTEDKSINIKVRLSPTYVSTQTIGTVSFTTGSKIGVVTISSPYTLYPSDIIYLEGQNTTYLSSFKDFAITLIGKTSYG